MDGLLILAKHKIRLPSYGPVPTKIESDAKLLPFFSRCLGAVDGSHFAVRTPLDEQPAWRNRKQQLTQNVMAACDFNGRFVYVLCGWEGSAHDGRVFHDATFNKGFHIPEGFYYLGDAGYPNTRRLLTPFRGVRYHLQETARTQLRPKNPEELFNLRHSQIRTDIERVLGSLKREFRVHRTSAEFSVTTQIKIISNSWSVELDG